MSRATDLDVVNRELYIRNAELAVRNKTLSLLRKIDDITMTALETGDMTRNIAVILAREFMYPFVAIGVADHNRRHLEWKSVACLDKRSPLCQPECVWQPISLSSRTNRVAQAFRAGRRTTATLHGAMASSVPSDIVENVARTGDVKSVLILPLTGGTQCIGVLVVGLNRMPKDLTVYEKDTLASLLNLVTIAIQKAETYTSLVNTTEKLRGANHKLRELDALKTEFLSIASHQLRTPLAITKGYIAMLVDGMLGQVNEKQNQALQNLSTSNEQLIQLVNHLLDLTRIESGRLVVKIEPIDMSRIVSWVVGFMTPRAEEKGLKIVLVQPKETVMAKADAEKAKELVMNLVDNAMKYTEKGTVTVTLDHRDGVVSVRVKDTGYGMTEKDKRHLFEKFARGSASANAQMSSGLGLYVCKKLVDAMNGTISAESPGKGRGSTFAITLPASH